MSAVLYQISWWNCDSFVILQIKTNYWNKVESSRPSRIPRAMTRFGFFVWMFNEPACWLSASIKNVKIPILVKVTVLLTQTHYFRCSRWLRQKTTKRKCKSCVEQSTNFLVQHNAERFFLESDAKKCEILIKHPLRRAAPIESSLHSNVCT